MTGLNIAGYVIQNQLTGKLHDGVHKAGPKVYKTVKSAAAVMKRRHMFNCVVVPCFVFDITECQK